MVKNAHPHYTSEYSISYSPLSYMNTLDVHIPVIDEQTSSSDDEDKYWIVHIHGGAWRDPSNTSKDILPALPYLSPNKLPIAGIASVNYRLTKYPSHPSDPSKPDDAARNVTHPAHIEDVLTAIQWLQRKYGFGSKYILTGHSCGATLAFQAVMGCWSPHKHTKGAANDFDLPEGVAGFEGIYNLGELLDTHRGIPIYKEFIEDTFSSDPRAWELANPIMGQYHRTWPTAKVVLLAHSVDDELVDETQTTQMLARLIRTPKPGRRDYMLELKGSHRDVWFLGEEYARGVKFALEQINEKALDYKSENRAG